MQVNNLECEVGVLSESLNLMEEAWKQKYESVCLSVQGVYCIKHKGRIYICLSLRLSIMFLRGGRERRERVWWARSAWWSSRGGRHRQIDGPPPPHTPRARAHTEHECVWVLYLSIKALQANEAEKIRFMLGLKPWNL